MFFIDFPMVPMENHRKKMDEYFTKIIRSGNFQDLAQTREQIQSCFEKVKCFALCYPGRAIPKNNYKIQDHIYSKNSKDERKLKWIF